MNGFQLTFFTEQGRWHQQKPLGEWLLTFARAHGAAGGTVVGGAEGFDHHGHLHTVQFFELGKKPLAVTVSIAEDACRRLLDALSLEDLDLAYVRVPAEYGRVGGAAASPTWSAL